MSGLPRLSTTLAARYIGVFWYGCRRLMFIPVTSMSGLSFRVHVGKAGRYGGLNECFVRNVY